MKNSSFVYRTRFLFSVIEPVGCEHLQATVLDEALHIPIFFQGKTLKIAEPRKREANNSKALTISTGYVVQDKMQHKPTDL